MNEPALPIATEVEAALLGAILINPGSLVEVADLVQAGDFYIQRHRWVYEACVALHEQRTPVDFLSVMRALQKQGHLQEAGGPQWLSGLTDGVPNAMHAASYAREVEETAVWRRLMQAGSEIAQMAYRQAGPVAAALERAESRLRGVMERRSPQDLEPLAPVVALYYDRLEAQMEGRAAFSRPDTGYADLDRLLGGMGPGNFYIVAGRPGMGKTAFLLGTLAHAALQPELKGPVAFFSLEMTAEQVVGRLMVTHAEVPMRPMSAAGISPEKWRKLQAARPWLNKLPVYLYGLPELTPGKLRACCRQLYWRHGPLRLIILDYVQLMRSDRGLESRAHEVSVISNQIKALALELGTPILAAAQLNRACDIRPDKHPQLSDLKESGSLEQDADAVMLLYREDYYKKDASQKPNVVDINLAKHRHGPTGSVEMYWDGPLMRILPLEKRRLVGGVMVTVRE